MARTTSRMTVVEHLYYQRMTENGTQYDCLFDRVIESAELPYLREIAIGQEPIALDLGWVKNVAMVQIKNLEGQFLMVEPTKEQRDEAMSRVVELCLTLPDGLYPIASIHPREGLRICLTRPECYKLRCLFQTATCKIVVIPAA